ncbi:MAG: hypothetical protein M3T55_08000 [Pseudomonadota bacterium]|nr:hypothetical protein [Pseudomonadota bacterium]
MGSCRVHDPLIALASLGDLRLDAIQPLITHTASEALQSLYFIAGDKTFPKALDIYLYGEIGFRPPEAFRRAMRAGVEISHDRQFSFEGVFLQSTFLACHLVRPRGSALLDWFRTLSKGREVDEACVQRAIVALRQGGFGCHAWLEALLRGMRFEQQSEESIEINLETMMLQWGGHWIVVGPIVLAGHDGAIMGRRRALRATLETVAGRRGAEFHDPSPLVAERGSSAALAAEGANIYEYAPDFQAVVGESLVDRVRQPPGLNERRPARRPWTSPRRRLRTEYSRRSALVERLNLELAALHRARLGRLGPEASGLYDHYVALLERGPLIGARERAVLELIHTCLPSHGGYCVLRASLGETALLLAASGLAVTAVEPRFNRRRAIEAGLRHLAAADLIDGALPRVSASLALATPMAAGTLGVGLNVGLVAGDPETAAEIERMAAFGALLIDPAFFFRPPSDGTERPGLEETLAALGFAHRRDYPADGLAWFHR